MYYVNPVLKDLVRVFDQNERKDFLRLDLNENPGGLSQEFINKVLSDVTPQLVSQYPETLHFTQVLANFLQTDVSHLSPHLRHNEKTTAKNLPPFSTPTPG